MAFDLRWLQATDEQVRAAAPPEHKDLKPFPRRTLLTGVIAVAAAIVLTIVFNVFGVDSGWAHSLIGVSIIVAVCCGIGIFIWWGGDYKSQTDLRLTWVGAANGFFYKPEGLTSVDTVLLHHGSDLTGRRFFWKSDGQEFGTLEYTTGSGKNSHTHRWHYVAAHLPAPLPHMMLDAKANDFLGSDLPESFARTQRLSLEGDFDKHFTLYAPVEYQQDALYVFTPDVMAALIDYAADYNVEIVDDGIIFFATPGLDYENPRDWIEADRLLNAALPKIAARASRYLDEHAGAQQAPRAIDVAAATAAADHLEATGDAPAGAAFTAAASASLPVIAPQGRRLKGSRRAIGIGGIIVLGIIALNLIFNSIVSWLGH
ncbi:hypothetical protein GCM10022286_19170 [Gryllotalpicola daejeonensis]|uniref:DUF3137 domain-containing protein n=1 Tax=Gryllotalpicola daejeonensis TaxID=993087 RepID=A0ABP7ZKE7_9MICO